MNMNRSWILFLVFGLIASYLPGQQNQKDTTLIAKILHRKENASITLQVACKNNGKETEHFFYEMQISQQDSRGNNISNKQGGEIELAPGEMEVSSSTTLNYQQGAKLEVFLKLLQKKKIIATDTFRLGMITPTPPNEAPGGGGASNIKEKFQDSALEFGGIIIDHTRTRMGREFYDLFYSNWEDPEGVGDFMIKIEEFPFRGRNTMIVVWLDDDKLIETPLRPQYDYIEGLSGYAISQLTQVLAQRKEAQRNLNDEFRDTGI